MNKGLDHWTLHARMHVTCMHMSCVYALEAHETIVGEGGLSHYLCSHGDDLLLTIEKNPALLGPCI